MPASKTQEEMRMPGFFQTRILLPLIVMAAALALPVQRARADDFTLDADQIRAALHTTTDIDNGFIDKTIGMVKAGTLPRELFTSTFLWARKKPRHRFQYFKQALISRAAEQGIKL
jgi:hypothetical protein